MTGWTAAQLDLLEGADEVGISSRRPDGSLRPFITIWAVRSGDGVFVRSAYGPENGWFRRALASGEGRIRAPGMERDVAFEEPGPDVDEALNRAYHTKYDRHGARYVATVVSAEAARCTLRLVPR